MRNVAVVMAAVVMLSFPAHADDTGGVQPATMEKYQKVKQQVEALAGTPAASLAPEVATEAARSVAAAQEGLKAGNDRVTHEAVETALLQVTLARVLADERLSAGKTSVVRAELEKLEQRLAAILAGKGDK